MERMSWKNGWHDVNDWLSIHCEGGYIIGAMVKGGSTYDRKAAYAYEPGKDGGLDIVPYPIKADKRHFEKLYWR